MKKNLTPSPSIKLLELPKRQTLDLIFSFCNITTFKSDTYYNDIRNTNRLFLVLSPGARLGSVGPENFPNQIQVLKRNTIVLIPKGLSLKMFFPKGLKLAAFHFNACDVLGRELFSQTNQIYSLDHSSAWIGLFHQFLKAPLKRNFIDFLTTLLGEFHLNYPENVEVDDQTLISFKPIFELLGHQPPARLNVKKLAQVMGKSESALSKAFNRLTGIPLKSFLLKHTIQKVERALIYTAAPMKAIAAELGFEDEFAFSKFTKRHLGQAPSHFRENNQAFLELVRKG